MDLEAMKQAVLHGEALKRDRNFGQMSFKPHPTVRSRSSGNVTAAAAEQVVSATGGSSSQLQLGREAPVWVPDTASDRCQACDRKFSLIVRRHHCRCCGRLLCSSCSSFFVPLPYLDWQVARVCQVCDQALSNPSARNRQRTGEHRRSSSLSSLTTQEK